MYKLTAKDFLDICAIDLKNGTPLNAICEKDVITFKIKNKTFYRLINNDDLTKSNEGFPFYSVQKKLCEGFIKRIPVSNCSFAYQEGRSYLDFFEPHKSSYHFLKLDLRSFFPSISEKLFRESFLPYFSNETIYEGSKSSVFDTFSNLVAFRGRDKSFLLPIGFPSSPLISNVAFRKTDILIQKFCDSVGVIYSRYADDMMFSSERENSVPSSERFKAEISYLVSLAGFKINNKKTLEGSDTISVNGFVIGGRDSDNISLSLKKIKPLLKALYCFEQGKSSDYILKKHFDFNVKKVSFNYKPSDDFLKKFFNDQFSNKLSGYRSFLISVIKHNNKNNEKEGNTRLHPLILKIEDILLQLRLGLSIKSRRKN